VAVSTRLPILGREDGDGSLQVHLDPAGRKLRVLVEPLKIREILDLIGYD